jgi:hypothetical protein
MTQIMGNTRTTLTPDTPFSVHRPRYIRFIVFHFGCKGCQGCQKHRWIGGFLPDTPGNPDNRKSLTADYGSKIEINCSLDGINHTESLVAAMTRGPKK